MSDRSLLPLEVDLVDVSGRNKVAEPSDPYAATAVGFATPGHDGMAAMARTFVEEFARLGWSRRAIAHMFTTPRYTAAHAVYLSRGPGYVAGLIEAVMGPVSEEEA